MVKPLRGAAALAVLLIVTAGRASAICETGIPAAMVDQLNSGTAKPGQPFRFITTKESAPNGVRIPPGTVGVGIVRAVGAAGRRDRYGSLAIEPRYLMLPHGKLQQVAMDPNMPASWSTNTSNVDKAAGHIPIPVPGLAMSAVNMLRFGKNVTLGPGFTFDVVPIFDLLKHPPC